MTKDYAPKPTKRPWHRGAWAKRVRRASFSPASFVGGVVCCATAIVAIDHLPGWFASSNGKTTQTGEAVPLHAELPLTYEFIHRLPNEAVRTNVVPYEPPAEDAGEAVDAPPQVYLLQAASFLRSDDAEAMRAELLLEGMEAKVSAVARPGGRTWHRVLVGPFAGRTEMARALTRLRERDIPALPLVRKTNAENQRPAGA